MNVLIVNWKDTQKHPEGPWATICREDETLQTMQENLDDSYGGAEYCEEQVVEQIQIDDRYRDVLEGLAALALSSEDLCLAVEHLLTRAYLAGSAAARKE